MFTIPVEVFDEARRARITRIANTIPTPAPAPSTTATSRATSRTTSLLRAPSAMRIPISRARRETANAITA